MLGLLKVQRWSMWRSIGRLLGRRATTRDALLRGWTDRIA
jgi:hypothetical protein